MNPQQTEAPTLGHAAPCRQSRRRTISAAIPEHRRPDAPGPPRAVTASVLFNRISCAVHPLTGNNRESAGALIEVTMATAPLSRGAEPSGSLDGQQERWGHISVHDRILPIRIERVKNSAGATARRVKPRSSRLLPRCSRACAVPARLSAAAMLLSCQSACTANLRPAMPAPCAPPSVSRSARRCGRYASAFSCRWRSGRRHPPRRNARRCNRQAALPPRGG
jgi:hypothetical protein